jgi:hypothetical protein
MKPEYKKGQAPAPAANERAMAPPAPGFLAIRVAKLPSPMRYNWVGWEIGWQARGRSLLAGRVGQAGFDRFRLAHPKARLVSGFPPCFQYFEIKKILRVEGRTDGEADGRAGNEGTERSAFSRGGEWPEPHTRSQPEARSIPRSRPLFSIFWDQKKLPRAQITAPALPPTQKP